MDIATLTRTVAEDAAIRRRQRLQPAGGQGDKIFPPTYPSDGRGGPRHVYERRRVPGRAEPVTCVLVDSVQSQANRLEEALLGAVRGGGVTLPHVVVDFRNRGLAGVEEITSLDAPHRVYDALLRDSALGDTPFMESPVGKLLKLGDTRAILETSPTALLLGAWNSTGEGGGVGAKFARALVSEIVAVDVPVDEIANPRTGEVELRTAGRRTSSRIDPVSVLRGVEVFKGDSGWAVTQKEAGKNAKKVRPSEINHGNIMPSVDALGVTCDYLEHTVVLSCAGLRRLRFGGPALDAAGRAYLAALGLLAVLEQDQRGYTLRSRCDLVCDGRVPLDVVRPDGTTAPVSLDLAGARALYAAAFEAAAKAGFQMPATPLRLAPQDKLVAIIQKSQELALSGSGGEDEAAAG